jgi:hypothetical protein
MSFSMNAPLSELTSEIISSYLHFPDDGSNAIDLNAGSGYPLYNITKKINNIFLFAGTSFHDSEHSDLFKNSYVRFCLSDYKAETKITNQSFSFALVVPRINEYLMRDLFYHIDPYLIPDFEKEERDRIEMEKNQNQYLDFDDIEFTEEQKQKIQESMELKIQKSVQERKKEHLKNMKQQEEKANLYRDDLSYLKNMTNYLVKGGILCFVIPKEFLDLTISSRLAYHYEDIAIYRLSDSEYYRSKKCIIFAKKKLHPEKNPEEAQRIHQFQYQVSFQDIPVLSIQEQTLYTVPVTQKEMVKNFRVGPLSHQEVSTLFSKSTFISKYFEEQSKNFIHEKPKPPSQLREGHVSLCLTSGQLNGYVGTGPDQHLVKASVTKRIGRPIVEEDETTGQTIIKENEYFHSSIIYLNRYGSFHQLL